MLMFSSKCQNTVRRELPRTPCVTYKISTSTMEQQFVNHLNVLVLSTSLSLSFGVFFLPRTQPCLYVLLHVNLKPILDPYRLLP